MGLIDCVMKDAKTKLVLVHWTTMQFETLFVVTPQDLILNGIYKKTAVPFFPPGQDSGT